MINTKNDFLKHFSADKNRWARLSETNINEFEKISLVQKSIFSWYIFRTAPLPYGLKWKVQNSLDLFYGELHTICNEGKTHCFIIQIPQKLKTINNLNYLITMPPKTISENISDKISTRMQSQVLNLIIMDDTIQYLIGSNPSILGSFT